MQLLNKFKCLIFAWLLFFGYSGISHAEVYEARSGDGEIRFEADSTLHAIHGHAGQWTGTADFDAKTGGVKVPFQIKVPVASLDTASAARDKAMFKMFDAARYPEAVLDIRSMECRPNGSSFNCRASGVFTIHGNSAAKDMEITLKPAGSHAVQSFVQIPLSLADFGLKPPSVLGMIKVGKIVELNVKINWRKK